MATLFKRGKVWYSKLEIHGKEVRKPLSTNERIAWSKLADLIKLRDAVKRGHAPADLSLEDFRAKYIEFRKNDGMKPNTYEGDDRAIRNMIDTGLARKLSQLSPGLLEQVRSLWMKTRINEKSKKPRIYVVNRDLRSIKTALYWAQRQGLIVKQDWDEVKEIKTPKGRLHWLTIDELRRLKTKCRGIWLTLLYLGARAGLRPAEIHWLEWSDIDLLRNRIHIAPKTDWAPKDYERRSIPILHEDLRAHLKGASARATSSRVFCDNGHIPTTDSMTVYFTRLANKAGLKATPYTLRHTFGSHYAQNGGNLRRLKDYMGHSSIETTMIYAHLGPAEGDKTLEKTPGI